MTYFSRTVQLPPLAFDVLSASSEQQTGSRHNVVNDSSLWAMRWAPSEHDESPSLLLRLRQPAIVHSISFGKFSRPVGDNARDVVVLGGWHADALAPLLTARLRNSATVQTFTLTSSISIDEDNSNIDILDNEVDINDKPSSSTGTVQLQQVRRVPFAIRFVRVLVRSSWSLKNNAAIWHIALHGDQRPALVARARAAVDRIVAARQLRRSLVMLRRRGATLAFNSLLASAGALRLEHPLVAALFRAAIDAPTSLDVAAALEALLARPDVRRLFDARALAEPPTGARWRRVPPSLPWPAARGGHQLCFDHATGRAYLFGGWTGTADLDDLWFYEPATQRWTPIKPVDGDAPSARSCHKIAFDAVRRRIYTLGRYVEPALEPPRPIVTPTAVDDDDELLLPWRRTAAAATAAAATNTALDGAAADDASELVRERRAARWRRYRRMPLGIRPWQINEDLSVDLDATPPSQVAATTTNDDNDDEREIDDFVVVHEDDQLGESGGSGVATFEPAAPAVASGSSNSNSIADNGGLSSETTNNLSLAASLVSEFDEAAFAILLDMWRHGFLGDRSRGSDTVASEASDGANASVPAAHQGVAAAHSWLENNARRARSLLTAVDYVGVLAMLINGLPDDLLEQLERVFDGQLVLDDASESGVSLERARFEEADFWYYSLDENRWHCVSRDTAADGGPPLIYDQQMCSSEDGRFVYVFGGRCVDDRARRVVQREPISAADLRRAVDDIVHGGELADNSNAAATTTASQQRAPSGVAAAASSSSSSSSSTRPTTLMSVRARLAVRPRSRAATSSNNGNNNGASHHSYCGLYMYDVDAARWTQLEQDEVNHVLKPTPPSDATVSNDAFVDDSDMYHNVPLRSRIGHSMSLVDNKLHILGGQRESEYLADHVIYDLKRRCITRLHRDSSLLGGPGAGFTQRALLNREHGEIHVLSGLVRSSHAARELVRNSLWVYSLPRDRWSLVVADGELATSSEQPHCSLDDMLGAGVSQRRGDGSDDEDDDTVAVDEWPPAPPTPLSSAAAPAPHKPTLPQGGEAPVRTAGKHVDRPAPRYAHQWVSDGATHLLFGGNPGWARPKDTARLDDLWELKLERIDGSTLAERALFLTRQFHFERLCDAVASARASGADAGKVALATEQALAYLQTKVQGEGADLQRLAARLLLPTNNAVDAAADDDDDEDVRARVYMVERICRLLPTASIAPLE
jgi:hypothetical protein